MTIQLHLTTLDDPNSDRSIAKGATYNCIIFLLPTDYTEWQPSGEIKDKHEGETIQVFRFSPIEYRDYVLNSGTDTQKTVKASIVAPYLTATDTSALPWAETYMRSRSCLEEVARPGLNVWVYEIRLTNPTDSADIVVVSSGHVEVRQ